MLLTIIIPVYNVEKYLRKCLESIIRQDFNDYEVILIDDCSTDSSVEIAKEYIDDERISIIKKSKNTGLSDSRNIALQQAKGEYIVFLDSDDYHSGESLRNIANAIVENNYPDIIYTGFVEEDSQHSIECYGFVSKKNVLWERDIFLLNELRCRTLYAPACFGIYKKSLLLDNKLYFKLGILHEDELWTPNVILSAKNIFTSEMTFYHYVRHENSITKKKDKTKNGMDLLDICDELVSLSENIDNREIQRLFNNHIAMLYMKGAAIGKINYTTGKIKRTFPIKRVCFFRDIIKAIVFLINLNLYYYLDARHEGRNVK